LPGGNIRLEGSCKAQISSASGGVGIERLEAHFYGQAFSPHRHDIYAIGLTLAGVQTFRFRGEQRYCLPGQCHILHPDETHDGAAATDAGFGYRIAYIDPSLIQQALCGTSLPFVAEPVVDATRVAEHCSTDLWDLDSDIDEYRQAELISGIASMLADVAAPGKSLRGPLPLDRLSLVRDCIGSRPDKQHSLQELERIAGLDRWTLARQFRAAFGTSPSRYRTMRQLDQVRRLLKRGLSLTEAAFEAGFADQSHMTRHFKRTYGLTPGDWMAAQRVPG
jgi:AraC-like DNA-binding protein